MDTRLASPETKQFFDLPEGVTPKKWEEQAPKESEAPTDSPESRVKLLEQAFAAVSIEATDAQTEQKLQDSIDKLVEKLNVDKNTKDGDAVSRPYDSNLALYVRSCFEASERTRKVLEDDWLDALRQYRGIYTPDVLAKIVPTRSRAFVRVTRTKVKTVNSRLMDLLFPSNGDKNWGIRPTNIPNFTKRKEEEIIKLYEQETGEKISSAKLASLIQTEAARQCKKMEVVIEDQLEELKYREIMREVIHSGNVYGTGILKGPLAAIVENKQYYKAIESDGKESWLLRDYDRIIPFAESIRIWDVYPDMEAIHFDDTRYIVQRRKMSKSQLVSLSKRSDFSQDIIRKYLSDFPEGDYQKKSFELMLDDIGDLISSGHDNLVKARKYEVLEYWGYIDTYTLAQWGMPIPEDKKNWVDIPCNVWVLGNQVIKCAIHPIEGVRWPFYVYYFDKDETSIFGEGIPSVMKTMQDMINAAFRAMLDNAAISAGPQLEVNLDLLSEDEDPREIHPFKVWLRTGTGLDASNPCVKSISLPSYTTEFGKMLELFGAYSDEITTIPRYMWGDTDVKGAGRTSSGLSMLMGSANMAIKDQVKNFDDGITTPFIKAMYHWNMQFNEDEDIKGDYTAIARGSASLIAKEMYTQYLIQFLNVTSNPTDAGIIKRPQIIRAIADAFDISSDQFILSDEEIAAQRQQEQEAQAQQQEFMNTIIETARETGTSPDALTSAMKNLLTQQKQLLQIQKEVQDRKPEVDYRNYYFTNAPGQGRGNQTGF